MHTVIASGGYGLEALKKWADEDIVSLKARLGELGATEEQMEAVQAKLNEL